jgi:hypothetical protein
MNTATSIAQIANPIVSLIFVIVLGVGYYYQWKVSRKTLDEMREQRISGGRPQVIVDDDYGSLPEVDIVVRNVSSGPAKDISFEFSTPMESSEGYVVSDLPYFRDGLDFLAPDGRISVYWDHLDRLLPFLREKGLEGGISVTTRYRDLAGEHYSTDWTLNPFIYQNHRHVRHSSMDDLVEALKELSGKVDEVTDRLGNPDGSKKGGC